ncbi:hypothetical protein ACWGKQ_01730 [Streptomyces sp. NPDC054770]
MANTAVSSHAARGVTIVMLTAAYRTSPAGTPAGSPGTAGRSWATHSAVTTWPGVAPRVRATVQQDFSQLS